MNNLIHQSLMLLLLVVFWIFNYTPKHLKILNFNIAFSIFGGILNPKHFKILSLAVLFSLIGGSLNLVAMLPYGKMPVLYESCSTPKCVNIMHQSSTHFFFYSFDEVQFPYLSDIIPFFENSMSIGDIFCLVGLLFVGMLIGLLILEWISELKHIKKEILEWFWN